MLFNSFEFLFFFPVAVIIYYSLPHRFRWIWLLVASYYFYLAWEPSLIFLLVASTAIDFFCGYRMSLLPKRSRRKKYLYLSIFSNVSILFFFKYLGFFSATTISILNFFGINVAQDTSNSAYQVSNIILPIGISFYTFQTLSYSFDVYSGKILAEKNFGRFALYVSFFPQLVAGPIERPDRLLPQFLKNVSIDTDRIKKGLIIMAWGFFLKLVVADRIGIYVDSAFMNTNNLTGLPLLLGNYLFAFQIYYDFAAYTTIAIGAAYTMGFTLVENFNRPFFGKGIGDFWRRWHISLMTWFRDYVYKPLVSKFGIPSFFGVLIVFLITGLWHGANWTFVIWGLLNGIYLVSEIGINKFWKSKGLKPIFSSFPLLHKLTVWLIGFHLIVFSLIFFRSFSVEHAFLYIKNMFQINQLHINIINDKIEIVLMLSLILLVQTINYLKGDNKVYEIVLNRSRPIRWTIYIVYIIVMVLFGISVKEPFIYHQF